MSGMRKCAACGHHFIYGPYSKHEPKAMSIIRLVTNDANGQQNFVCDQKCYETYAKKNCITCGRPHAVLEKTS